MSEYWKDTLGAAAVWAVCALFVWALLSDDIKSIATCPIHVMTTYPNGAVRDDYCINLGVGR